MLSAQTTDVTVNRVTERLFRKYRRPEDYLAVPRGARGGSSPDGHLPPEGQDLRGAMRMLLEEFDGEVPTRLDDLVRLPGVGRKTANVVAAERGATQGIVVDTHVRRLSQRLGFTRQEDPVKIERDLMRLVPAEDWARFPHLLIWHGRRVCIARAPRCEDCAVHATSARRAGSEFLRPRATCGQLRSTVEPCARSTSLSIADELAARAATLAARLERARCRLRQAAIEREARRALDETSVARLESLGVLRLAQPTDVREEIRELASSLEALEELQAWVERRLFEAGDEAA